MVKCNDFRYYENKAVVRCYFKVRCAKEGWNFNEFEEVFAEWYNRADGIREKKYNYIYRGVSMVVTDAEVKEFVNRFGLTLGDLKRSPPYEYVMVMDMARKDKLRQEFIDKLEELFRGRPLKTGKKCVLQKETGVIKTLSGWNMYYKNNFLYLMFSKPEIREVEWKGYTFIKEGDWNAN